MDLLVVKNIFIRAQESWFKRTVALKAVSFGLIGVLNTFVDVGVFSFLYFYLGFPIIGANVASWILAVSSSYVLNSSITFAVESRRKLSMRTYVMFTATQFAGFIVNTLGGIVASQLVPVLIAKMLATGGSLSVNFWLSHFFVFHQKNEKAGRANWLSRKNTN